MAYDCVGGRGDDRNSLEQQEEEKNLRIAPRFLGRPFLGQYQCFSTAGPREVLLESVI